MKIEISGKAFAQAVSGASRAVAKRVVKPLLGCVLVRAGEGVVSVDGTDGCVSVLRCLADGSDGVTIHEDGVVALDADNLVACLKAVGHEAMISLETTRKGKAEGEVVYVRGTKARFQKEAAVTDPAGFPEMADPMVGEASFTVPADKLVSLLKGVLFSAHSGKFDTVASDSGRPMLVKAIHLHTRSGRLIADATDTKRAMRGTVGVAANGDGTFRGLLPIRTAQVLLHNLDGGTVEVRMPADAEWREKKGRVGPMSFKTDGAAVTSAHMSGSPPMLDELGVFKPKSKSFAAERDALDAAVEAVRLCESNPNECYGMRLDLSPGLLALSARSQDRTATVTADLPAEYEGEAVSLRLAPDYLREFLRTVGEGTKVRVELDGPNGGVLFRPADGGVDRTYVMQPLGDDA